MMARVIYCMVLIITLVNAGRIPPSNILSDGTVLTPFGYWPAECVHGVAHASHVTNHRDHLLVEERHELNGQVLSAFKIQRCNQFTQSSIQEMQNKKRQHEKVVNMATQSVQSVNDLPNPGSGWQAYTHQNAGNVTEFLGQWTVPKQPVVGFTGQTLFTFTGLQNIDWIPPQPQPTGQPFDIIQPVLQYGSSAAGTMYTWSMASWYVTLGTDVVFSPLTVVEDNTIIFGNMTMVDGVNGSWYCNTVDTKSQKQTSFTIHRTLLLKQPWIYVTLEVYGVDACNQYPPSDSTFTYTQMSLKVGKNRFVPKWTVGTQGQNPAVCGSSIVVKSPSEIIIGMQY